MNSRINSRKERKLIARCSYCGREGVYELSEEEFLLFQHYQIYGRQLGYIQDIFPDVPAWIRSGAIDKYAEGFCICPDCCG